MTHRFLNDRLLSDRRGGVSIMVAAGGSVILVCAAFAVDIGSIYLQSRRLQGVADLAAMAAAKDLPRATAAAEATVTSNGLQGATAELVLGRYTPDPAKTTTQRFVAGGAATAVKVTLRSKARLTFGAAILGKTEIPISRSATAAQTQLASFSIGSRLAALDGGVANALLSGLTGSNVSLSVMDYEALAKADIDLLRYIPALATRLNLQAASFDKVLQTDVAPAEALRGLADLLRTDGKTREASAMEILAQASVGRPNMKLATLLDLGVYGKQDRASKSSEAAIKVSSLDMVKGLLTVSQEGRQLTLDLAAKLPGLVDTKAYLAIGERPNNSPWLTVARDGSVILRTAQMRLYTEASVGTPAILGLDIAKVRLPVLVQLAEGRGRISAIDCAGDKVTVEASPGIGRLIIGEIDTTKLKDFKTALVVNDAKIVSAVIVTATAKAETQVGGEQWKSLTFTRSDISSGVIRTASTRDTVQTTVATLLGQTNVTVNVLGIPLLNLGLLKGKATTAVTNGLATLTPALDGVVNSLTDLLGVRLGEVDVRVNGLRCHDAALVA